MKIFVHVKEKTILVQCGDGTQRIRWLGNVGIARYDSHNGLELGIPKGVALEDGTLMDMNQQINTRLADDQHVW
eukprot:CAMPEP_0196665834 /NCGR_PEP_ID=MMETSP1086-20130531/62728_1 /TAXON_ID=77921 /ORGANISM="Cyanoptyche  gloeocystis , Strain SAG4.97" /LENGTH=73 /DNA_ID=CAMNT_0042002789 /DNA_START=87 /DNA_END=305 /DNA_ORIENTATION=+